MVVVMEERATEAQIEHVVARLVEMGMDVHRRRASPGPCSAQSVAPDPGRLMPPVQEDLHLRAAQRQSHVRPESTVVKVGDVCIGGDESRDR
jgi:hypothetical protein